MQCNTSSVEGKRELEKDMWTESFKYSRRKMEARAQDQAVAYVPPRVTRHKKYFKILLEPDLHSRNCKSGRDLEGNYNLCNHSYSLNQITQQQLKK